VIDPTIVQLLAGLVQAGVRGVLEALSSEARAQVEEQLVAARERLPAPGSVSADVEEVIARHANANVERAHVQARAETVRDRYHLTDTVQQAASLAAAGQALTHEQRGELAIGARFIAAALRGELAPAVPPVLDVPVGAWSEGPEGL
jgi:hypothetical protein